MFRWLLLNAAGLALIFSPLQAEDAVLSVDFSSHAGGWTAIDSKGVSFSEDAAFLKGKRGLQFSGDSAEVAEVLRESGELSLVVWLSVEEMNQEGPARILTLSKNTSERLFTLGQENGAIDVRLRTSRTSKNGVPSLATGKGSFQKGENFVVYTFDADGNATLYLNGERAARKSIGGDLSNWNNDHKLLLGDEASGGRTWKGKVFSAAIYDFALTAEEVKSLSQQGKVGDLTRLSRNDTASELDPNEELFETRITTILTQHCLECHDSSNAKGDLDLSKRLASHEANGIIIPGKPANSLLWETIESDEMPAKRDPLSVEEKALVREWLEEGASWTVEFVDPAIYSRPAEEARPWARRLTVDEYISTVRDTLGVDIEKEARELLPSDVRADGFSNTAYNLTVDLEHIEAFSQLAEIIVARADLDEFTKQFTKSRQLTDKNMIAFIENMGEFVLRGPLNENEKALYRGISTTAASMNGGFLESSGLVLEAMLQSPRFVYRVERELSRKGRILADDYELASRLSYTLWGSSPDHELMKLARSGRLNNADMIAKQATRMLDDDRAVAHSRKFISEWLHLDHLANLQPSGEMFPNWEASLAEAMREETLSYFQEVVWKDNLPLSALLNTQYSFMTPELARHYGINDQGKDGEIQRYDLTGVPGRGGILTQGSTLTVGGDEASMVTRGLFVLKDLLRGLIKDPPPCVDTTPESATGGQTRRDLAMERVSNKQCGGCHSKFEPLAYGLERFDGLGSYFEKDEHGNVPREDGKVIFPGEADAVAFESVDELMDLLAASDRVKETITWKLVQFAMGRPLTARDAAEVSSIHESARQNGGRYQDVMSAIVSSDLIRYLPAEPRTSSN